MGVNREAAINLGKKMTNSREIFTDATNVDYWETEGYIGYLIRNE